MPKQQTLYTALRARASLSSRAWDLALTSSRYLHRAEVATQTTSRTSGSGSLRRIDTRVVSKCLTTLTGQPSVRNKISQAIFQTCHPSLLLLRFGTPQIFVYPVFHVYLYLIVAINSCLRKIKRSKLHGQVEPTKPSQAHLQPDESLRWAKEPDQLRQFGQHCTARRQCLLWVVSLQRPTQICLHWHSQEGSGKFSTDIAWPSYWAKK